MTIQTYRRSFVRACTCALILLVQPSSAHALAPTKNPSSPVPFAGPVPWEITWQWLEGGVCTAGSVFSRPGNLLCTTEACIPSTTFPGALTTVASCIQLVTNAEFQSAVEAGITPAAISTILDPDDSVRLVEALFKMRHASEAAEDLLSASDPCAPASSFADYDKLRFYDDPHPATCTEADRAGTTRTRVACNKRWSYDCTVPVCGDGYEDDLWGKSTWTMNRVFLCTYDGQPGAPNDE